MSAELDRLAKVRALRQDILAAALYDMARYRDLSSVQRMTVNDLLDDISNAGISGPPAQDAHE